MSRRRITISIRYEYLNNVPHDRVGQIHIAGHSKFEKYILDTHDHPVLDPVWKLYAHADQARRPHGDACSNGTTASRASTKSTTRRSRRTSSSKNIRKRRGLSVAVARGKLRSCKADGDGVFRPLTAQDGMQPRWTDGRKTSDAGADHSSSLTIG